MDIEFQSHPHCLCHLEHYFCYLLDNYPISQIKRDQIRLCFYEAVTNAVLHGNAYDETKKVLIQSTYGNSRFKLTITDQGAGFRMMDVPNPFESYNLNKQSGRGVHFIMNNSSLCHYDLINRTMAIEWDL
jgi:anti-sigma regulatory factor (Ser/Thr protein kinase)